MEKRSRRESTWRPLFKLLKDSHLPWWLYLIQLVLVVLSSQLFVSLTEITGAVAQGLITDQDVVRRYIIYSVLLIVLGFIPLFTSWVHIRFDRLIQQTAWRKFIDLPLRVYEKFVPSSLISRVTTDSLLVSLIIEQMMSFFQAGLFMAMMIYSMQGMNLTLTLFIVPTVILYVLLLLLASNVIYSIKFDTQQNMSRFTLFLSEKLGNMKIVKAAAAEAEEMTRGMSINQERFKIAMREVKYDMVMIAFQRIVDMILMAIVIIGGSFMIQKGELDLGELIVFYMFTMEMPSTFQMFVQTLLEMQGTKGATAMVAEIAALPAEQIEREIGLEEIPERSLELRNLSFSYDGETKILDSLNLSIPEGKTTAIIGASGSGKTTILKLLERFYEPSSGELLIGETEAERIHLDSWRKSFGYVIQNSPLLAGTIRENILYGANREISEEDLIAAAKKANAYEFIMDLPDGFDSEIGESGMKLSGGQRQRIAIARAIIGEPEILLLDEATANMDAANEFYVTEKIRELMAGKTMVIVAHNLNTIVDADQIVLLEAGKIVAIGPHRDLYQGSPYYRRIFDLQAACSLNTAEES
ncbi:MAG: ABC transporter ATP-binding protein [Eubacteriales bacterium]|nr:ABC transporter ATP-binding protein [Eubacteriales bacterium]